MVEFQSRSFFRSFIHMTLRDIYTQPIIYIVTSYVPDTVVASGDTAMNKTAKPCTKSLHCCGEGWLERIVNKRSI